jgi:hypothetical protein
MIMQSCRRPGNDLARLWQKDAFRGISYRLGAARLPLEPEYANRK